MTPYKTNNIPTVAKLVDVFAPIVTYHAHQTQTSLVSNKDPETALIFADPFGNSMAGAYVSPP